MKRFNVQMVVKGVPDEYGHGDVRREILAKLSGMFSGRIEVESITAEQIVGPSVVVYERKEGGIEAEIFPATVSYRQRLREMQNDGHKVLLVKDGE
jgi:hypothetical protein